MQSRAGEVLEFNGFCLDVAERKLTRDGRFVPLPPKAFELLTLFVRRCGHLLEKDAIMQALWPDTCVEEANLANYVSLLRRTLGQSADGQEYIETVPRKGYRFLRPVCPRCRDRAGGEDDIRCVAVLPFADLDSNAANDSFRDGLTEELINELVQVEPLRVAARSTVWRFRDQPVDVRDAGRALNVDAVVEGSVRRHGGLVRITAQLIRCSDGCHAWSKAYDRAYDNPLSVQREVSHAIACEIRAGLLPRRDRREPRRTLPFPIRLMVLPFRALNDDDRDAAGSLGRVLAEAIAGDLLCLDSLRVRSSLVAEGFGSTHLDLSELAAVAQVDVIVTGTLMRSGSAFKSYIQLVDVPEGTLRASSVSDGLFPDVLSLRNRIVEDIVKGLNQDLSSKQTLSLARGIPISCRAFELYLRANEIIRHRSVQNFAVARDLYRECLNEDPDYAPAWAQLGRCYRFLSKFGDLDRNAIGLAEQCLQRALAISPDLPLARAVYAMLQADLGRACDAMRDLLERARSHPDEPNQFAGLVNACRFCGQLQASLRAHDKARALDPNVITSVEHTWFLLGDYERALKLYPGSSGFYMDAAALATLGRHGEALRLLDVRRKKNLSFGPVQGLMDSLEAILQGDSSGAVRVVAEAVPGAKERAELESLFYFARHLAHLDAVSGAHELVSWLLANGFCCVAALEADPWFGSIRKAPEFQELLSRGRTLELANREAFACAGGFEVLPE